MFTISLIARQDCLDPHLTTALHGAWAGGKLTHLSPGEADEFEVAQTPSNFESVRADLLPQGVDVNIIPTEGRRKRLLIADMDSTMIEQECIDELAAEAGVGDRVADITARAMNGELDFNSALQERVALLRGVPETVIADVIENRLSLTPGGICLVRTMRANGAHASLVSGGFTAFTAEIAKRIGFHDHAANHLDIIDGHLTGEVIPPILGRQAKVDAMTRLMKTLHIGAENVLAVGDGANDLGMLGMAGMGVALHAKPVVAEQCDIRIHNGDLTALLFLQGYSRDCFRNH